ALQLLVRQLIEFLDTDVTDITALGARADRTDLDDLPRQGHDDRLCNFRTLDVERHLRSDRAAKFCYHVAERKLVDRLPVDLRNDIAGKNAGLGGGRAVDR